MVGLWFLFWLLCNLLLWLLFNAKLSFHCFLHLFWEYFYGQSSCCLITVHKRCVATSSTQLSCWRTVPMTASTSSMLKCPWARLLVRPVGAFLHCLTTTSDLRVEVVEREKLILHTSTYFYIIPIHAGSSPANDKDNWPVRCLIPVAAFCFCNSFSVSECIFIQGFYIYDD